MTRIEYPRDLPDGVRQFWAEHRHYGSGLKLCTPVCDLPGGANQHEARRWIKEHGWRYEKRSHMYFAPNHFNDPADRPQATEKP